MKSMITILLIWMILPLIVILTGIILLIKNYKKKDSIEVENKISFAGIFLFVIGLIWCYFSLKKLGFL